MNPTRLVVAAVAATVLLSGCAGTSQDHPVTRPSNSSSPSVAAPLLARYGLQGLDAAQIVDRLDRLGLAERPADLKASVRPEELELTWGKMVYALPLPADRFYLSVAPYVDSTHECFYHSLTTCKGELADQAVRVVVTDSHGTVLFDGARTTFDNGFVGFWLPRDITGTLSVTYGARSGQVRFATDDHAPTCLTSLRLS